MIFNRIINRQLFFYIPPIFGIGTYLLLIHFFDGLLAPSLAVVNTVAGATSLISTTVFYTPAEARKKIVGIFLKPSIALATLVLIAWEFLSGHYSSMATSVVSIIFLYFSLRSVGSNDESTAIKASIISAVVMPLSALLGTFSSIFFMRQLDMRQLYFHYFCLSMKSEFCLN